MKILMLVAFFTFAGFQVRAADQVECIVVCKDSEPLDNYSFKRSSTKPVKTESNLNCYDPVLTCSGMSDCFNGSEIKWTEIQSRTGKKIESQKITGKCSEDKRFGQIFRAPIKKGLIWGEGKFVISGISNAVFYYKAAAGE